MKKQGKRILIAVLSILAMCAMDAVLAILYWKTKYLPFLLAMGVLLLPTLLNVFVLLLGRDIRVPAQRMATVSKETGEDVNDADASDRKESGGRRRLAKKHKVKAFFLNLPYHFVRAFNRVRRPILYLLLPLLIIGTHVFFWLTFRRTTSIYAFTYLEPLLLILGFILSLALGKWCRYSKESDGVPTDSILENLSSAFALRQIGLLFMAACTLLRMLAGYDAQKIAVWAAAILLCYETVFLFISFAVKLIRREFDRDPDLSVPIPLSGQTKDVGILSYLEKNTGITMRSLWSIRLIKYILPYVLMAGVAIFWLATGVVQIGPNQMGAHYRMGRLEDRVLQPGLHLTLPWPFDRVEIYDTETIGKITIGYASNENSDNTWTGNHGNSEYKLLMGSGNELCSINLRIEYKISDLKQYVSTAAIPEKLLESKAYELVTERTIETDLNSLLSVDRSAFSASLKEALAAEIEQYGIGLEVVSVILESIHPPVEVAQSYQQIIGAEIDAQRMLYDAEAQAISTLEDAKKQAYTAEQKALAAKYEAIAAAESDVAEFMASVEADAVNPSAYRYYKYLAAITKAYGGGRLVIVGDGVDTSKIYFGDVTPLK